MHGFGGATSVYDVAQSDNGRELIALYCGDFDPSGMCMSEQDLPDRLEKYGGDHVSLRRIALTREDCNGLSSSSFPASDKKNDPRYKWFIRHYGDKCWELDAMDPNDLRSRVGRAIKHHRRVEERMMGKDTLMEEGEKLLRNLIEQHPNCTMCGRKLTMVEGGHLVAEIGRVQMFCHRCFEAHKATRYH
jgi:hypothetical protein